MSTLDYQTLSHLSHLCRIQCSEEELLGLLPDVTRIVDYIELLKEVDTAGVSPCNHVLEDHLEEVSQPLREDHADNALERQEFLSNSPQHIGGMLRVPNVL